jgi:hypothetical protein
MATMPTPFKTTLLGLISLAMVISFSSCTKKISFLNSSIVPAARGYVEIKSDKNKNNVIEIHLTDLAEVQRLEPARQTYVVWMITDENLIKNLGQIKSSSSMMSKQLKASFETVSSFKPTRIFITAEDDANTQYAGKQIVLSTKNF